jgi:hypothetical protein
MDDLVLDPSIRDWVLIPIFIIMFLMGILRNNVTKMMRTTEQTKRETVQHNNQLMRARRLRANAGWVPASAFAARKHFFLEKDKGMLMQKHEAPNPMSMMQARTRTATRKANTGVGGATRGLTLSPSFSRTRA